MYRRWVSWLILFVVIAIAMAMPVYRHFYLHYPIIKQGLELQGGIDVELRATPDDRHTPTPDEMRDTMRMLRKGIDPKGTKDITIAQVGKDRIALQLPGESDPDMLLSILFTGRETSKQR